MKSPATDIHSLGELLSQDTLLERKHRHVQFSAVDVFTLGYRRIAEGSPLDSFNAELRSTGETAVVDGGGDRIENDVELSTDYLVGF